MTFPFIAQLITIYTACDDFSAPIYKFNSAQMETLHFSTFA